MFNRTKIKKIFIAFLILVLIGAFFYFYNLSEKKKTELNLAQNSDNQKQGVVEENIGNQNNNADIPEKAENIAKDDGAVSFPAESKKDAKIVDNSSVTDVENNTEVPKVTKLSIINRFVSFGFQASFGRKIDTIIVHSSYDAVGNDPYSVSGVIAEYKSYGVSPHYLVDRKGNVYRLVKDDYIAYHAGESKMPDGRTGVNNFSIGIEVLTTKKDAPTDAQYSALKLLISNLKGEYKITSVLGHSQIAPGRKDDPWNFDWSRLK